LFVCLFVWVPFFVSGMDDQSEMTKRRKSSSRWTSPSSSLSPSCSSLSISRQEEEGVAYEVIHGDFNLGFNGSVHLGGCLDSIDYQVLVLLQLRSSQQQRRIGGRVLRLVLFNTWKTRVNNKEPRREKRSTHSQSPQCQPQQW